MPTQARRHLAVILAALVGVAVLHAATPSGPHSWHWLHLLSEKLYYVPIVLGAALFGRRGAVGAALGASLLYAVHIATDWAGLPMVQASEFAAIVSFWLLALVAGILFSREREALDQLRVAHDETLGALAASLELRERYTAGHSRRVRDYSLLLADAMGLVDATFRESLAQGAFLHDVGKIGIPDGLLLRAGPLTEDEWREMRRHPALGADLVGGIGFLHGAREIVLGHHERWDGQGYPLGLAGDAVPLGARVFAVVDAFDALTTDRPYHAAQTYDSAIREIARGRGSQFDAVVVDAFVRVPFDKLANVASTVGVTLRSGG